MKTKNCLTCENPRNPYSLECTECVLESMAQQKKEERIIPAAIAFAFCIFVWLLLWVIT